MSQWWLNPPTDNAPPRRVLLALDPDEVATIVAALRVAEKYAADAAASLGQPDPRVGRRDRGLYSLAAELEGAAEPVDAERMSTADPYHPANNLSRTMTAALTGLARWSGPVGLVLNAVQHAAAIAADRDGPEGVAELAKRVRDAADRIEVTQFGAVPAFRNLRPGEQ